jgi:hypothetical protein
VAIEIFLRGGLGNQLFQYAAGLYLAGKQNEKAVFRSDLLPIEPDSIANVFRWPIQIGEFKLDGTISSHSNQPHGSTTGFSKLMQVGRIMGDYFPQFMIRLGYLYGEAFLPDDYSSLPSIRRINSYCTSAQPAMLLGDSLREQITDLVNPSRKFEEIMAESEKLKPTMVHLRLGDYRGLSNLYGKANVGKLQEIIEVSSASSGGPVWLFTDSPEDVGVELTSQLGVDRVLGPNILPAPIENMIAMSSGANLICANSTFSWWAAFLKGPKGTVFFPKATGVPIRVFKDDMVLWDWTGYDAT